MTDEQWLEQVWQQYYKLLYDTGRYSLKNSPAQMDKLYDDIQEVFLALWKKRKKLREHPNIGGWLVRALQYQLQASKRKGYQDTAHTAYSMDDENAPEFEGKQQAIDAVLLNDEKRAALNDILGNENAALFLSYILEGKTAKELAARYCMSEDSVWVRISRMKKKLLKHPEIFYVFLVALLGLNY